MTERSPGQPNPPETISAPSKQSSVIKTLGEYKELISIIVFFVGGIFFAFTYFATKQQLAQTRCLLNENVDFIQGKMDYASLSQLMVQNLEESGPLDNKTPLTPLETIKKNKLKETASEITRKLAEADALSAKALTKLKGGCIDD